MTVLQLQRWRHWLWRPVRLLLLTISALWFLFEEFGWHPLAAWLGRFGRWPPWARMESRIARAPPRLALVLFVLPATLLLPVKLMALHLIQAGRPVAGLSVILAAKVVGTALGGRLFVLVRPQLMHIRRFARLMAWWRYLRRRARHVLRWSTALAMLRAKLRATLRASLQQARQRFSRTYGRFRGRG